MKISLKPLLAAALLAFPVGAQAQAPIDPSVLVRINSWPFQTRGTGYADAGIAGGFLADFTIDFPTKPSVTFDDYLVWCIDPNRSISVPGGPYAYQAFSAMGFANTAFGGANGYDVTPLDMGRIVSLVSDLSTNWSSYTQTQKRDRQGSIWATFRGDPPVIASIPTASTHGWVVLFDGQHQTLLTYVPEPADAALMLTAVLGMAFVAIGRRRRV